MRKRNTWRRRLAVALPLVAVLESCTEDPKVHSASEHSVVGLSCTEDPRIHSASEHREAFGTLEKPKFPITRDLPEGLKYHTWRSIYGDGRGVDLSLLKRESRKARPASRLSLEEGVEEYGDVFVKARNLAYLVTGKKLPDKFRMCRGESENEISSGQYDFRIWEIRMPDGPYLNTLMSIMHELGHAYAQHREHIYFTKGIPDREDISIMEEASAYAFQFAVSYHMPKSDLRDQAILFNKSCLMTSLPKYFKGDESTVRNGLALADAALTYFGDPNDAYNYLATTNFKDLDEGIRKIVEENKEKYKKF